MGKKTHPSSLLPVAPGSQANLACASEVPGQQPWNYPDAKATWGANKKTIGSNWNRNISQAGKPKLEVAWFEREPCLFYPHFKGLSVDVRLVGIQTPNPSTD